MTSLPFRTRVLPLALAALLVMPPDVSLAWSDAGHRIIAQIAWQLLTPDERSVITGLIRNNPRFSEDFVPRETLTPNTDIVAAEWEFGQAAVWSDLIRGNDDFDHPTWHYINRPVFLSEQDKAAMNGQTPANIETELDAGTPVERYNAIQAIKHNLKILADPEQSDSDKGEAICWIFHLVGDVHQPLHSSAMFNRGLLFEGDRGGNMIRTDSGNLHSFWDGLLGRRAQMNDMRRDAFLIMSEPMHVDAATKAAGDLQPETWITEGQELCREYVYSPVVVEGIKRWIASGEPRCPEFVLPEDYKTTAGSVARVRAAEGGFRLAAILKEIARQNASADSAVETEAAAAAN